MPEGTYPPRSPGEYAMVLADFVLGRTQHNPPNAAGMRRPNEGFHSTSTTQSCDLFCVYEDGQAHPTYLINFKLE